jgi:hypothetical protein
MCGKYQGGFIGKMLRGVRTIKNNVKKKCVPPGIEPTTSPFWHFQIEKRAKKKKSFSLVSGSAVTQNSCPNCPKKAMALWALFWQPQRFHRFCEVLESNDCTVRGLSANFIKFNPGKLSQHSQKGNSRVGAFFGSHNW